MNDLRNAQKDCADYRKLLYGFFGHRLNNSERVEDLVQETFLAAIRARPRYEPRALFERICMALR